MKKNGPDFIYQAIQVFLPFIYTGLECKMIDAGRAASNELLLNFGETLFYFDCSVDKSSDVFSKWN